jgi:hypothetical protein
MPRHSARWRAGRPPLRAGFAAPWSDDAERIVLPLRRSWLVIGIVLAVAVGMTLPAVGAFENALTEFGRLKQLANLVSAVFLSAWLLGWSAGLAVIYGVLLLMLFGREVLRLRPGALEIRLEVAGFGLASVFDAARMRNLQPARPTPKSGTAWRGPHLAFDYGAGWPVEFGSNIAGEQAMALIRRVERGLGGPIAEGLAPASAGAQRQAAAPDPPAAAPAPAAGAPAPTLRSASTLALLVANLIPVAGALLCGWNLGELMVLYWAESGVIAVYNVAKMAVIARWLALPAGVFFFAHFGAFMAIHFLFVYELFVRGATRGAGATLAEVGAMFAALWPALAALFVSHGISFWRNFIARREYVGRTLKQQMSAPYARIVAMHLALIVGGGVTLVLGSPTPVLLVLVALKIGADLRAHLRERRPRAARGP